MAATKAGHTLRSALKKIPGLRSSYYLFTALTQMAKDQWRRPGSFDSIFQTRADPWTSTSPSEKERFSVTLSVLADSKREAFASAVELGCAEGIFTERLAPLCSDLLALDFSEIALNRARERLGNTPAVRFRPWDMRRQSLDGQFDLVVAMGVVTSLYRPSDVRRVCAGIVSAIRPGGFLLFSDVRQSAVFEEAWWGRFVLRGGEQIRRLLARHSELELVSTADTSTHVFALFRRGAEIPQSAHIA